MTISKNYGTAVYYFREVKTRILHVPYVSQTENFPENPRIYMRNGDKRRISVYYW